MVSQHGNRFWTDHTEGEIALAVQSEDEETMSGDQQERERGQKDRVQGQEQRHQRHQHPEPRRDGMQQELGDHREARDQGRAQDHARDLPSQQDRPQPPERPARSIQAFPQGRPGGLILVEDDRKEQDRANINVRDGHQKNGAQQAADDDGRDETRGTIGKVIVDVMGRQKRCVGQSAEQGERGRGQQPVRPARLPPAARAAAVANRGFA